MPIKNKKFLLQIYTIATLAGTIIGVGLFSLPYITLQVGILPMLAYFFILGALVLTLHLFFAELTLKTPDFKRLPGFAEIYLGKKGKIISTLSVVIGLFGASLAYLIVGGEFLSRLLGPFFGGNVFFWTFFYFFVGALIVFFGIKAIAKVEFWGLLIFIFALIAIFTKGFSVLNLTNISTNLFPLTFTGKNIFLPYGPILFSLWGLSLIPEIEEMLGKNKKLIKKVVAISVIIPVVVYLFFIFTILGITGKETTESALTGLQNFFGNGVVSLALLFGVITTFTSFVALAMTLKKTFWFDLKINKKLAWAITCFTPFILFLLGIKSFIGVISFVGAVMLGIDGILVLLMYKKITPKRKVIIYSLISALALGIAYELFYFLT
ncbi:hypothetical protein FJ208_00515 [Candidatus Gribaldobacteria bacterium]|nr:hypothetical protein [Candidatus Gribaldobacteria bacterium]